MHDTKNLTCWSGAMVLALPCWLEAMVLALPCWLGAMAAVLVLSEDIVRLCFGEDVD